MVVVQEDGTPCRMKSATIRSFAYLVDALFFGLIGYMAMKAGRQRRRHGDQWARTIVCNRSALAREQLRTGRHFVLALVLATVADSALVLLGLLSKLLA